MLQIYWNKLQKKSWRKTRDKAEKCKKVLSMNQLSFFFFFFNSVTKFNKKVFLRLRFYVDPLKFIFIQNFLKIFLRRGKQESNKAERTTNGKKKKKSKTQTILYHKIFLIYSIETFLFLECVLMMFSDAIVLHARYRWYQG